MGDCSPAAYIHMVQCMIENCLIFNMSKEECMKALSENANINPVITSTVWKELVKTNKEFFETYERKRAHEKCVNAGERDKQDDL
ncbi:unnamed protein product [Eruca vesicaria subsp. sativa]|uniref:Uncharacterized protein n=1 Tax=Eruca vesicaria subsp. sativa TaxID=29727 RepID=A0ABC8KPY4_ERUVS|nr:unnamed protein product [Eruca vesicaria subsp. sativa]